jgi:glycosyltransferase involved in cell wall biosynthesis
MRHSASSAGMLVARMHQRYYWSRPWVKAALKQLKDIKADLFLVNDLPLLPTIVRLAGDRPVIFDAHEYYPRQKTETLTQRLLFRPYMESILRVYLPRTNGMLTVSPGLQREYEAMFGVRPALLRNCPNRQSLTPRKTQEKILLVHHGTAQPRRKTESIIKAAINAGERFELHLFLVTSNKRLADLKRSAAGCSRIFFHAPVPNDQLCKIINQYDVGVTFFEPTTFNLKHCLPNKLFEYIQARLAVITGPSPDISQIVKETNCGLTTDRFTVDSLAASLRTLTPERIDVFKQQSDLASESLTWEIESEVLQDMIQKQLASVPPVEKSF